MEVSGVYCGKGEVEMDQFLGMVVKAFGDKVRCWVGYKEAGWQEVSIDKIISFAQQIKHAEEICGRLEKLKK